MAATIPTLRVVSGVRALADGPSLAALIRRVANAVTLRPEDTHALRAVADAMETAEPAAPGAWAGCTVTIDPGETEVDTSDAAIADLANDVILRARASLGGAVRVVEINFSAVVTREVSDA